jgi:hypothetical protein
VYIFSSNAEILLCFQLRYTVGNLYRVSHETSVKRMVNIPSYALTERSYIGLGHVSNSNKINYPQENKIFLRQVTTVADL